MEPRRGRPSGYNSTAKSTCLDILLNYFNVAHGLSLLRTRSGNSTDVRNLLKPHTPIRGSVFGRPSISRRMPQSPEAFGVFIRYTLPISLCPHVSRRGRLVSGPMSGRTAELFRHKNQRSDYALTYEWSKIGHSFRLNYIRCPKKRPKREVPRRPLR